MEERDGGIRTEEEGNKEIRSEERRKEGREELRGHL